MTTAKKIIDFKPSERSFKRLVPLRPLLGRESSKPNRFDPTNSSKKVSIYKTPSLENKMEIIQSFYRRRLR